MAAEGLTNYLVYHVYSYYRFILASPFSGLLTAILAWHLNKGIIIIIIIITIIIIIIIIMQCTAEIQGEIIFY